MQILKTLALLAAVFAVAYAGSMLGSRKSDTPSQSSALSSKVYERVLASKTMRCGYFIWPPQLKKDPNTGQLSGILYDYVEALGGALGLKVEWTTDLSVGDYIEALGTDRFDVLCMTQWPDPARVGNTLTTIPAFYTTLYPAVRVDDQRFEKGVEALNSPDVTIAVIDGDISATLTARDFPKAKVLALPQMSDYSQLLVSVTTRKADVTFLDYGMIHDFIAGNGKQVKIPGDWQATYTFPEVFSVRKGEVALKQFLDTGVNILTNNKVGDKILTQYVTSTFPPTTDFDEVRARDQLRVFQAKQ